MDAVTIIILIGIGLLTIATITLWSFKRYEIAVCFVGLSPWLSALFIPPNSDDLVEATLGSYLRISLLIWMGMVGVIQYIRFRLSHSEKIPIHFVLFGIFLLFGLLSTGYSIDPKFTLIRSCSSIALFGFLIGLHYWLRDCQKIDQVLNTIFLLVCFFIIIDAISIVIFPERAWWELNNRFQGLWTHPNTMGSICMISYPILLWKYSRCSPIKKSMIILLIIIVASMHLLTGSRGSLLATFFGTFVWFFVQKRKVKMMLLVGMIGILILSIIHFRPSSFGREEGAKFTDLTGREQFWSGSYTLLMERPILGFGYGIEGKIWEDPRFFESKETLWSGSAKTSLHNGYISIAIGLGVIGFFIWCIILLSPLWQSMSLPANDYKAFAYAVMVMCMVLNLNESVLTDTSSLAAILFWIAWVLAGRLPIRDIKTMGLGREASASPTRIN
jgi:O-antigen ligase